MSSFENITHSEDFVIEDGVLKEYKGNSADVIIPYGVEKIEGGCFSGEKIHSIVVPGSLKKIGYRAFENCIDDNVSFLSVYIGDLAAWCNIEFDNIESNPMYRGADLYLDGRLLTDLVIPDSVTEIKKFTFAGCRSIKNIKLHSGVTSIGHGAFEFCGVTTVTMKNNLKKIDNAAFACCYNLSAITIPNSVTEIGGACFLACENLTDVTISENITEIDGGIFARCESLVYVKIPNGVKKIGAEAFRGCDSLTNVEIPESVTHICHSAFRAKNLISVVIPESVQNIEDYAFEYYWEAQGLCPKCGRKLRKGLLGKKCKKCKYDYRF